MDRAAGAQYPWLDTPVFLTLKFHEKTSTSDKTNSISSALLNLIKSTSAALRLLFSVRILMSKE